MTSAISEAVGPGPPFFVVGSARSGTTLLRLILNAHKDVAVPPESRFIVELWDGRSEVPASEFLVQLAAHKRFRIWDLPIEAVAEELPSGASVRYADAVQAPFRAFARAHGKQRWGDKTPRYVESLDFIAALLPDAKFIHLVRDGRNVALSYADVDFGPNTVGGAARIWAQRVNAGLRAGRGLGPARCLELHYESFVENTEKTSRDLCRFLELEFDPGMLEFTSRARAAVTTRAEKFNRHLTEGAVREVRSWEQQMSKREVEIFESIAGDTLVDAGYERVFPRPRAGARIAAWLGARGLPVGRMRSSRPRTAPRLTPGSKKT